jgi:glutathione S-transferase
MPNPLLVLGNKAYSSWSLRPYLALKTAGIAFDEQVIRLYEPESKPEILKFSPAGKVPVLVDDAVAVWESLAICEYAAEKYPDVGLWPAEPHARAHARSIAAEMHAGFMALRRAMPFNARRTPRPIATDADTNADIARIAQLWRDARARFGADGAFLFGRFSIADAMYAPVAGRFRQYAVELDPVCAAYVDAVHALPAMRQWIADGTQEPWFVERFELV